jgi:hypothetical protein
VWQAWAPDLLVFAPWHCSIVSLFSSPPIYVFTSNLGGKDIVLAILLECPHLVLTNVIVFVDPMTVQDQQRNVTRALAVCFLKRFNLVVDCRQSGFITIGAEAFVCFRGFPTCYLCSLLFKVGVVFGSRLLWSCRSFSLSVQVWRVLVPAGTQQDWGRDDKVLGLRALALSSKPRVHCLPFLSLFVSSIETSLLEQCTSSHHGKAAYFHSSAASLADTMLFSPRSNEFWYVGNLVKVDAEFPVM